MNWKQTTLATLAASALTCAFAIAPPQPKSSNPVPPATIATSAMPGGMAASSYAAADKRLADNIVDALNSDSSLQGSKITVLAANGDVTLSGSVMTSSQADKAADIASKKNSAGRVTSAITVGRG